jgi:ribosomal protein S27E
MWGIEHGPSIHYDDAIALIHPDDQAGVQEAISAALGGLDEGAYHREFRVIWPDGSIHWIASHGRVYFEGDGDARKAMRFIGANRDISRRKRDEEKLAALAQTLAEKNKELETIVYVASHDLRSPLVNIQGFSRELAHACDRLRRILDADSSVPESEMHRLLMEDIPEALGLEHGFLRVRCEECHAAKLVAFSCKRRGFCPSCGARRMTDSAALPADEVLPQKPLRQWVLSLPFGLRFLLATDAETLTQVLGIVYRTISAYVLNKARLTRASGATGAVR